MSKVVEVLVETFAGGLPAQADSRCGGLVELGVWEGGWGVHVVRMRAACKRQGGLLVMRLGERGARPWVRIPGR